MAEKTDNPYNPNDEIVLVKWKVDIDAENFWGCKFLSMKGYEPKLLVRRYYVGTDKKWHWPDEAERIPFNVLVTIVSHAGEIEKAYQSRKWIAKGDKQKTQSPAQEYA